MNRKHTIESVKKHFEDHGCQLLSTEYYNTDQKLNYICVCGNTSAIKFDSFKRGQRCKACGIKKGSGNKKHKIDEVRKIFDDGNCILISDVFENARVPMDYMCSCGNRSRISLDNFKRGQRCKECGLEKLADNFKHKIEYVRHLFQSSGCKLVSTEYINGHTPLDYICLCENLSKICLFDFRAGKRCWNCALERRFGENNWNWQGGITPLHNFLRTKILPWKKDSIKASNFKCVVTNERFDAIHHLYNFNKIFQEVMDTLNLPIFKQINLYNESELNDITQLCLDLHYKYGLGVCLTNEAHNEFHSIYGNTDNTPEQFDEYKGNKLCTV